MTLFIACLLIHLCNFDNPQGAYIVAVALWLLHLGFHNNSK